MFPSNMIIASANQAKQLPSGSILAIDELHNEYFANYELYKKMPSTFNQLLDGKLAFLLYVDEVWTGEKWKNKQVKRIVFISNDLETIHTFQRLTIEREGALLNKSKKNREYFEFLESTIETLKYFSERNPSKLTSDDVHKLIFSNSNEEFNSLLNPFDKQQQQEDLLKFELESLEIKINDLNEKIDLMLK